MMAIPVSFGAIIQEIVTYDFASGPFTNSFDFTNFYHYLYYLTGFMASLIMTFFALKWVFIWFRRGNLTFFYIYNFIFGMILLFMGALR